MRKIKFVLLSLIAASILTQPIFAGVDLGVSFDEEGLKEFHLAIGEHYRVPEKEIVIIRKNNIPEEELPVVLFLAAQAKVSNKVIWQLRLKGKSWMEITRHFGLTAAIFYVNINSRPGPPYGKAIGYFKNRPRYRWDEIVLADADIVNFVNLKFISEHYGYSPNEIIDMKGKGRNFVEINKTMKDRKKADKEKFSDKTKGNKDKKKGKKKK